MPVFSLLGDVIHQQAENKQIFFEVSLVGNQWWRIKGQMLRYLISYPKNIFRFIRSVHVQLCISKRIKWIEKKSQKTRDVINGRSLVNMISQKYFQIYPPYPCASQNGCFFLKSHGDFLFCIFFQSTHQVGMKNIVKNYKDFFGFFNSLKTHDA